MSREVWLDLTVTAVKRSSLNITRQARIAFGSSKTWIWLYIFVAWLLVAGPEEVIFSLDGLCRGQQLIADIHCCALDSSALSSLLYLPACLP